MRHRNHIVRHGRGCYTAEVDTFFAELDALERVYRSQAAPEAAWRRVIEEKLSTIDASLPAYATIAGPERLATAERLRADIIDNLASGVVTSLQEVALGAAILEKALLDALRA